MLRQLYCWLGPLVLRRVGKGGHMPRAFGKLDGEAVGFQVLCNDLQHERGCCQRGLDYPVVDVLPMTDVREQGAQGGSACTAARTAAMTMQKPGWPSRFPWTKLP